MVNTTFVDCDGVTGSQTLVSEITVVGDEASFVAVQNGSYSTDQCEQVSVTDLRVAFSFDFPAPMPSNNTPIDGSASGLIAGVCEGMTFSCTLQDVDLSDDATLVEACLN